MAVRQLPKLCCRVNPLGSCNDCYIGPLCDTHASWYEIFEPTEPYDDPNGEGRRGWNFLEKAILCKECAKNARGQGFYLRAERGAR